MRERARRGDRDDASLRLSKARNRAVIDTTIPITGTGADTVMASLPVGGAPAGVAISHDGRSVYVANSNDSSVSVISVPTA